MAAKNKPNEIYINRIFDAPVKTVWNAWTDKNQVANWYGPRGFTITTHSSDIRTGGSWSYTMHGPDGTKWENKTVYLEVEKYKRMVYDHGGNDGRPPLFRVTVNFSEAGDKTKMEMIMTLPTAEAAAETKKMIKQANGNSTWDRLAEYVTGDEKFFINRTFDAPIATMWEMWTNPEHMAKWTPPTGFEMQFIKADVRPGGTSTYVMTGHGLKMYGAFTYKEMRKPHQLIYTQIFTDEHGKISRHPLAPTWPETMLTTLTLTEESSDLTRVTVQWEVFGEATAVEHETFHKEKPGMTQGWSGSFEKLDSYLAKR